MSDTQFANLSRAWKPVDNWFSRADVRCPCKAIVAPLLADWRAFSADWLSGAPRSDELDTHASNLQAAIGTIQKFAAKAGNDEDVGPFDPSSLLSGIAAMKDSCEAGDTFCRAIQEDPTMGAGTAPNASGASGVPGLDSLLGLLAPAVDEAAKTVGRAAQGPAADAGKAAGQAAAASATEAAKQAAPGVVAAASEAARAQIPTLVKQASDAASTLLQPLAEDLGRKAGKAAGEEAGKAAVKSAQEQARAEAWGTGEKVAGVVVTATVATAIGYGLYRLFGGGKRKKAA